MNKKIALQCSILLILASLLCILPLKARADLNSWTPIGPVLNTPVSPWPTYSYLMSITFSQTYADNGKIFASDETGYIYTYNKSTTKWSSFYLDSITPKPGTIQARDLAALTVTPGEWIFAASFGSRHLFRSKDGGINWEDITRDWQTGVPYNSVGDFAVSPDFVNDKTIFTSGNSDNINGPVARSTNGGDSWDMKSNGLPSFFMACMAISPDYRFGNGKPIFVAGYGVFRSTNDGDTWKAINGSSPNNLPISPSITALSLVLSPNFANDQTMFVAIQGNGIYKSTDEGQNWYRINSQALNSQKIAISPNFQNDGVILVKSPNLGTGSIPGIAISRDAGANWQILPSPPEYVSLIEISPTFATDQTIFAGVQGPEGISGIYAYTFDSSQNSPPTANAGPNQTVHVGATAILNGSGTDQDPGDSITSYNWTMVSRPPGSIAQLSNSAVANPTFTLDKEGYYFARLVVTDSHGAQSAADEVIISTQNSAPVANAGPDQIISRIGSEVQLNGTASKDLDGDQLSYQWTIITRPSSSTVTLNDPAATRPSFTTDKYGTYEAQLVVNDGWRSSSADTVVITFENIKPVANAGPDQFILTKGTTVNMDGSESTDANGDNLSYQWSLTKPDGTLGQLSDPTAVKPTFVADIHGDYLAQLIVSDGLLSSIADTVKISFTNVAPIAEAGNPQAIIQIGATVTLQGSASDANGDSLIYAWSFSSRPPGSTTILNASDTLTPTFKADVHGDYVVQLTVHDGFGSSATDTVTVSFTNVPPAADAGPDQSVYFCGTNVILDNSQSYDDNGDNLTFAWSFASKPIGSTAILADADTAAPSFIADLHGDYVVQLIVSDGLGGTATDTVTVSFNNLPPVASAIGSGAYPVAQTVTLDGTGSNDPNNDLLIFKWSLLSKPAGSAATVADPTAPVASLLLDAKGQYEVQLVVNDGVVNSPATTILITATLDSQAAIVAVQNLQQVTIANLEPSVFKNSNMKNTTINKLSSLAANIEAGKYQEALGQLQHDLLAKTDGCATSGAPDKNDWIQSSEDQAMVYQKLQQVIAMLQQLQ